MSVGEDGCGTCADEAGAPGTDLARQAEEFFQKLGIGSPASASDFERLRELIEPESEPFFIELTHSTMVTKG